MNANIGLDGVIDRNIVAELWFKGFSFQNGEQHEWNENMDQLFQLSDISLGHRMKVKCFFGED